MFPVMFAMGVASMAANAYAQNKQMEAQKDAAKKQAAAQTPNIAGSSAPQSAAPQQFRTGLEQQQQPVAFGAAPQQQAAKPFTPTQVVTSAGWDANQPGGGAAMAAPSSPVEGMWASDYSKGMAGAGAPQKLGPSVGDSWGNL